MKKIIFCIFSICILQTVSFAADVSGVVGLVVGSGDIKYGAKLDVFLASKKIPVRQVTQQRGSSRDSKLAYRRATFDSISAAYLAIEAEQKDNPDYIKGTAKTGFNGSFTFNNVSPGEYFVVVTFPSKISFNRVLWQVPVTVSDEDIYVELDNDNIDMTYFDR